MGDRISAPPARRLLPRLLVGAIAMLACGYGLAPAFAVLLPPAWRLYGFLAILLVVVLSLRGVNPTHAVLPRWRETVAAFVHSITPSAGVGAMGLVFYWVGYLLIKGAQAAVGLFGHRLTIPTDAIGRLVALAFMVFGLIGAAHLTVRGLGRQLFPNVAGYPTPYAVPLRSRRASIGIMAWALIVFVGLPLALTEPLSVLAATVLSFLLGGVLAAGWKKAGEAAAPRRFSTSEGAVGALLQRLAFEVVPQPRTGLADVDPYLEGVDFVAARDDRVFAILVRDASLSTDPNASPHDDTIDWDDAFRIALAAATLNDARDRIGLGIPVEPVLVVVGPLRSSLLHPAVEQEEVLLIHVPSADEINISEAEDEARLQEIAERTLRYLGEPRRFSRWEPPVPAAPSVRVAEATPRAGAETAREAS